MYLSFSSISLNDDSISYLCDCGNGIFQSHCNGNYTLCSCIKCSANISMSHVYGMHYNTKPLSKAAKCIKNIFVKDIEDYLNIQRSFKHV